MTDYSYDSTGIDPDARRGKALLPEGEYLFRINKAEAGKSTNGDFMVTLECEVINDIEFMGKKLSYWVTFMPKTKPDGSANNAAGMAIHFLKVIGEPWQGKFNVTVADWKGKTFKGVVKHEKSTSKKDGKEYTNDKIKFINYVEEPSLGNGVKADPKIPF